MRKPARLPSLQRQGSGPGPTGAIRSASSRWISWPLIALGLAAMPGCSATRTAMGPSGVLPGIKTTTSIGDRPVTVVAGVTGDSQSRRLELADQEDRSQGRISGQVLDERGRPVPEAEIRLADGSRPFGRDFRARTDASGRFTLRDLNPGSRYTLIADGGRRWSGRFGRAVAEAPDGDVLIRIGPSDELPSEDYQTAMDSDRDERSRIDRVSDRREVPVFDSEPPPLRINPDDLPDEGFQEIVAHDSEWGDPGPSLQRSGWRSAGPIGLAPIHVDGEVEADFIESLDEGEAGDLPVEVFQDRSAFGLPIEEDDIPNPLPPAIDRPDPSIPPNDFPDTAVGSAEPIDSLRPTEAPSDLDFPSASPEFPETPFEPSPDSRSLPEMPTDQANDVQDSTPEPEPESEPAAPSIPPAASEVDDSPPEVEGFPPPANLDPGAPDDQLTDDAIQEAFPEPDFPESNAVEEPSTTNPPDLLDPEPTDEPATSETPAITMPEEPELESEPLDEPQPEPAPEPESSSAMSLPEPEATDESAFQEADPKDIDSAMPADVFLRVDEDESEPPEVADLSTTDESPAPDEGADSESELLPPETKSPDLSDAGEPESIDPSSSDEETETFVAGPITEPVEDEPEDLDDEVPPLEDSAEESEDSKVSAAGPVGSSEPTARLALAEKPSADIEADSEAENAAKRSPRPTWRDLTLQSSVRRAQVYPPSVRRSGEPRAQNVALAKEDRKGRFGLNWLNGQRDQQIQLAACEFDERKNRLVDFTLPDLQGRPVRFRDLDADYLLLDFWGTWCGPCIQSIPRLVQIQNRYDPSRLRVIGVAYEQTEPAEGVERVEQAIQELGINYPILLGEHDQQPCPLASALKIQAYPTLILIDRHGRILWRDTGGGSQTFDRLDRVIAANIRDQASVIRR